MSDEENKETVETNPESNETPVTPEEVQEIETATPAVDPDAKSEDLPEPEVAEETTEATTETAEEEDLSKLEGEEVEKTQLNRHLRPGMVVRVHEIIADVTPSGEARRRIQVFEGTILGFKGHQIGRTMTVRKVSKGFGVEKIYPLASPNIEKVEVLRQLKVRRAKLNFLRGIFKRNVVKKRFKRKLKEVTKK